MGWRFLARGAFRGGFGRHRAALLQLQTHACQLKFTSPKKGRIAAVAVSSSVETQECSSARWQAQRPACRSPFAGGVLEDERYEETGVEVPHRSHNPSSRSSRSSSAAEFLNRGMVERNSASCLTGNGFLEPPMAGRPSLRGADCLPTSYSANSSAAKKKAYSSATSRSESKRPDLPPCPAPMLVLSSSRLVSVFRVRSLATYLAGSQ